MTVVPVTRYVPVEPVVPTNGVPATPWRTAICAPGRSCSSPVVSTDFTTPWTRPSRRTVTSLASSGPSPASSRTDVVTRSCPGARTSTV